MIGFRRLLGLIVAAYALFTAWGCATVLMMRNGITPPILPDPETMGSFVPVLMTLPSWNMLLWAGAAVLYAVAAWRLIAGLSHGAAWYTAALACDLGFLVLLKRAGAVKAPGVLDLDYVTAAITVTLGVLLWIVESRVRLPESRTA